MKPQLKIYKIVLPSKYRPESNYYDCHVICAESEKECIKIAIEKGGEQGWKNANPVLQGIYTGRLKSSHVIASSFKKEEVKYFEDIEEDNNNIEYCDEDGNIILI